ncbi:Proto-oncogene tyrosine-protein kinase LCK [Thelohanellus kitauei]|uniref:Proto-oncogene tyrosine-protein kinase LCK n=1 Tax=Thelohanellus kitauei TaxID=669202 RepID=A0A0C2M765_THEKT|nr:Proto-oncogene tyrosine-protein kinase LCK [Thelohanellus kitauei]
MTIENSTPNTKNDAAESNKKIPKKVKSISEIFYDHSQKTRARNYLAKFGSHGSFLLSYDAINNCYILEVQDQSSARFLYRVRDAKNRRFFMDPRFTFPTIEKLIEFHQTPNDSKIMVLGDPISRTEVEKYALI